MLVLHPICTMTDYPITPPPELVKQWWKEAQRADYSDDLPCWLTYVATQAARWGADQELEACCELMDRDFMAGPSDLRAARRPKPPSLKEQALDVLQRISKDKYPCNYQEDSDWDTIRRALDALPE